MILNKFITYLSYLYNPKTQILEATKVWKVLEILTMDKLFMIMLLCSL